MRPYSPGGTLNALAPARRGSNLPTPSVHRLLPGLQGYLILFATLAFVSQRQVSSRVSPSPLVFLSISTHFTATPRIPDSPPTSRVAVSDAVPGLSPGISHLTYHATYARFTPSNSEQRLGPSYYRGCWHEVSRPFLLRYYQDPTVLALSLYSLMTGVYNPRAVILHAASHHQAFAHCE